LTVSYLTVKNDGEIKIDGFKDKIKKVVYLF